MKLITNQSALSAQFLRLIREYKTIRWATAWAGIGSEPFTALVRAQHKIRQMVVGAHFYQTNPDFIDRFRTNKRVRFITQPDGVFHPKLYLFQDDNDTWEMVVGSGNFTNGAFTLNTEASLLVSSEDSGSHSVLAQALKLLEQSWDGARGFSKQELDAYRTTWKNHQAKLRSLSGRYGNRKAGGGGKAKPIPEVPVAIMTWREFMTKVRNDRRLSLSARLKMLARIQNWFTKEGDFGLLGAERRKFIAGLPNRLNDEEVDAGWFGSMKGAGRFGARICQNDPNISRALGAVPLSGEVTRSQYDAFLQHFSKSLQGTWVAPASRLLAMKRPDTFVCLDSKNLRRLCLAFGIPQAGMNYQRYWEDIVARIKDSEWWLHPDPKDDEARHVAAARAAFLDSLYYE
jgi:hypothetical protein